MVSRWKAPLTVPAEHIPSPTNSRIALHQEYAMRRGEYDALALVTAVTAEPIGHEMPSGERHVTFHALVETLGLEDAIRAVWSCAWVSADDVGSAERRPCRACAEVAYA